MSNSRQSRWSGAEVEQSSRDTGGYKHNEKAVLPGCSSRLQLNRSYPCHHHNAVFLVAKRCDAGMNLGNFDYIH